MISLALGMFLIASCSAPKKPDTDAYRLIKPASEQGAGYWAIIDKEGDTTEIAPEEGIAHVVEHGLSRQEAIDRASQGVQGAEIQIRSIAGRPDGTEAGIEVLPSEEQMKPPPNLVRIEYRTDEAGRLRFSIRLLPLYAPSPAGSQ